MALLEGLEPQRLRLWEGTWRDLSTPLTNAGSIGIGGDRLAIGDSSGAVTILDRTSGRVVAKRELHQESGSSSVMVTAVSLSGDGRRLASVASDRTAKVFDLERDFELGRWECDRPTSVIALDVAGQRVVTVDQSGTYRVSAADGSEAITFPGPGRCVAAAIGQDVTGFYADGSILSFDLAPMRDDARRLVADAQVRTGLVVAEGVVAVAHEALVAPTR